ncbi:UNVERIFIED_ORG: hypothetical protein FNL38_1011012 [Nocardia globerula]|uniref:Uncharacterized protein n=2 Tax=Nocardiaceae TaxID=85025 RepID=A0A652YYF5_NOCGL|nr:hypothetical protein C8E04_2230 [Rhodococcus globerulus]
MGSVAQIVIGLPLGLIAAGALWQALPFQSGIVIFVTAVVITLVLPALVAARKMIGSERGKQIDGVSVRIE